MPHILAETDTSDIIRLLDTWTDVREYGVPHDFEKGRRTPRNLDQITAVVLHQTAVRGGFGATLRTMAALPGDLLPEERTLLARAQRYRNTPYHGIYSPQDRASVVQWPAWMYTYHGNRSNRYSLGWAYDGKLPGDLLQADEARESLRHLLDYAKRAGCEIRHLEAHRQHSAQRGGDPGARIWREVAIPIAREYGLTFTDRTTGTGKPIPASWSG